MLVCLCYRTASKATARCPEKVSHAVRSIRLVFGSTRLICSTCKGRVGRTEGQSAANMAIFATEKDTGFFAALLLSIVTISSRAVGCISATSLTGSSPFLAELLTLRLDRQHSTRRTWVVPEMRIRPIEIRRAKRCLSTTIASRIDHKAEAVGSRCVACA